MKKVCIVCAGAVRNMVMIYMYTEFLNEIGVSYDLVYMDKYHEEEHTGAEVNYRLEYDSKSFLGKVGGYLGFVRKASKILKTRDYQFVIVWGELTAVLLSKVLREKYYNKYCINIRDLFVGRRSIFNKILHQTIMTANYVTVSSKRYLEKLPGDFKEYFFVHSLNKRIMAETSNVTATNVSDKIRILYIGNIRFLNHLYKFIDEIKNDSRFQLIVAGHGSDSIKSYVINNGINNVEIYTTFPKEQTGIFLSKADVIYNLYGTEDINLRMALSNKLYYAVCLNLPILVYKDTYMYDISKKCGIGFAVDDYVQGSFANEFYKWFKQLDRSKTLVNCKSLIEEANVSQEKMLLKLYEEISVKS